MQNVKKITSIILVLVLLVAFASVAFAADSYSLKPVRSVFNYGADVNFKYTGAVNAKDWIGIYDVGEQPGGPASIIWAYVGDSAKPDGTTDFAKIGQASDIVSIADLAKGKYVAYLCKDDGYEIAATANFEVLYNKGEAIPADAATTTAENPKTGDSGLMVGIVALILSAAGILLFRKKALN